MNWSPAQRLVVFLLALVLGIMLAMPLLDALTGGGTTDRVNGTPSVPSRATAPPRWNGERLVGTAWQADMSHATGEWQADLTFIYSFNRPGYVVMRTLDADAEDGVDELETSAEEDALRVEGSGENALPDFEGTYRVEDGTIHLDVPILGMKRTDTIAIRGRTLFYHGIPMTRVDPVTLGQ